MAKQKFDDSPTDEQARLEQEMQNSTPAGSTAIGSEFAKLEQKFIEEEARARATAEEMIANADEAQKKAAIARQRIAELTASEEAQYTYNLYSKHELTLAIKIDNTKRRVHLHLEGYKLTINRPFMKIVRDKFEVDMTPAQLADILKRHPGYGFDFTIKEPGVKLTPDQESFIRATAYKVNRKKNLVVTGMRSTREGREDE